MAEGADIRFGIALDVSGAPEADAAAFSLDTLAQQLQADQRELKAMQAALRNLKGGANVAAETISGLKDKVALHRAVIADTQAKYVELGGTFSSFGSKASAAGAASASAADQQRAAADAASLLGRNVLGANEQVLASSRIAASASGSLAELESQLASDAAAVSELKSTWDALGPRTEANAATFDRLKTKLESHGKALQFAKAKYVDLGGSAATLSNAMKKTPGETQTLTERFRGLGEGIAKGGGPLADVTGKLGKLSSVASGGVVVALGAAAAATVVLTVAVAALGAALVAATAKAVAFSVKLGLLNREEERLIESSAALANTRWIWWQRGRATADSLSTAVSNVALEMGSTRGETIRWGADLQKLGFRGKNLESALKGVTLAGMAAGDEGAKRARSMIASWYLWGDSVQGVVQRIENEFGELAEKARLDPGRQLERFHDNMKRIFALKPDGLLRALDKILSLFDEGTAVSDALGQVWHNMFGFLETGAEGAANPIIKLIKAMVIGALEIRIAWLKARVAFKAFSESPLGKLLTLDNVLTALKVTAIGLAAVVGGVLVVAIAGLAAGLALVLAPLVVIGAAVYGVYRAFQMVPKAIDFLKAKWTELGDWLITIDWGRAATNLIDGLVNGIKKGVGRVATAVKNLAKGIFGAFASATDSHSPSRKAITASGYVGQGVAIGLDRMQPKVRRSSEQLAKVVLDAQPQRPVAQPPQQPSALGVSLSAADLLPRGLRERVQPAPKPATVQPLRPQLPALSRQVAPALPPAYQVAAGAPEAPTAGGAAPAVADNRRDKTVPNIAPTERQAAPAKSGATITVGDVTISIGSVPDGVNAQQLGEDLWADFEERLMAKLEAAAAGMGAA